MVGVRLKNIFGTYLCRQSTLVLKLQPYLNVFNLAKFGAFLELFGPFGAIFGVWVRFKNFFGTYLCRHSTLVLEVKSYLFVFEPATFWPLFHFFGPFGAIFWPFGSIFLGRGQVSKTILEPTNVEYQFLF